MDFGRISQLFPDMRDRFPQIHRSDRESFSECGRFAIQAHPKRQGTFHFCAEHLDPEVTFYLGETSVNGATHEPAAPTEELMNFLQYPSGASSKSEGFMASSPK